MKARPFFSLLIILAVFLLVGSSWKTPLASKPNVVLIFVDDMGYGDLSCYGAMGYQTPNIDRLAVEGVRFTNFLATQAVCTASRAALLTGCYPNRIGISGAMFPRSLVGLNPSETTLPEILKANGYATAMFGKWHLGDNPNFLPMKHGFDEYVGLPYSNDMWPIDYDGKPVGENDWRKKSFPPLYLIEGDKPTREIRTLDDQASLTGIYTEKTVQFIKKHTKNPFFIYLAHAMPHVPIAASARFKGKSQQGMYGDVLMELDWSVGEVMKALKETGLDKNTLVVFTSDNGPWLNYGNHAGSSGGFREGKGVSTEGGHRVPCLVRWAGSIPAGVVCNKLGTNLDLLPTIAKACRAELLPNQKIDGVDLMPLLKGDLSQTPRKYFYYYYRKNNLEAVRRDDWKLVFPHPGRTYEGNVPGNDGYPGKAPEDHAYPMALFDLRRDLGERYDVQALYPDIVVELQQVAETAREDLGDDLTNRKGKNVRPVGSVQ